MVHDLENPVNTLDLHAQLLLRDQSLSPRARQSVQQIREGARALSRLILNLLDISKSEEGQLAPPRPSSISRASRLKFWTPSPSRRARPE